MFKGITSKSLYDLRIDTLIYGLVLAVILALTAWFAPLIQPLVLVVELVVMLFVAAIFSYKLTLKPENSGQDHVLLSLGLPRREVANAKLRAGLVALFIVSIFCGVGLYLGLHLRAGNINLGHFLLVLAINYLINASLLVIITGVALATGRKKVWLLIILLIVLFLGGIVVKETWLGVDNVAESVIELYTHATTANSVTLMSVALIVAMIIISVLIWVVSLISYARRDYIIK